MRDYFDYAREIELAMREARNLAAPSGKERPAFPVDPAKKPVLMIMPHPDDEMIVGALPLRFLRQCGRRVVVLSTTLGSNRVRQEARWAELRAACAYIGFEAKTVGARGLERINPDVREDSTRWRAAVEAVAEVVLKTIPEIVFFPHEGDANRTHRGVHFLAADALRAAKIPCAVFETEFWAAAEDPNVLVESDAEDVARLISALSLHSGEVARNPYHLRLPSWMIDNVRRGAELVGGQGGAAPDFVFATLYRHSFFDGADFRKSDRSVFLKVSADPEELLCAD